MNARINEAGNVNWTALKQLSEQNKDEEPFDIYDLLSFHSFFNNLYNRSAARTIIQGTKSLAKWIYSILTILHWSRN